MTARSAVVPSILVLSLAPSAAAQSPALFDAARFLVEAQGAKARELGDFDGDQDVDLINVLGSSPTWSGFRLLSNDGTARFSAGPPHDFPFDGGVISEFIGRAEPHAGDFDGDGNLDVAFDHYKNVYSSGVVGGLEVYFGDGAGGFSAPVNTGVATATAFAAGQADLDPADEIVVWGQAASGELFAWWLDWNGSAFQPSAGLPLGHGGDTGGGFVEGETLDLDGDGIDELVGRSQSFANLRVLETVGGQLAYGQVVALPATFVDTSATLAGGDFDGDGDPDVVVIRPEFGPSDDPVFLAHRNDGGVLVPLSEQAPTLPLLMDVGDDWQLRDWNEDGLGDLLEWAQFAGDGMGGFQLAGSIPLPSPFGEAGAADLDGDGHLDAAGPDAVYLGDGTIKTVPPGPKDPDLSALDTCAFVEDREGDGDLDILASSGEHPGFYKANDAAGGFTTVTALVGGSLGSLLVKARAFADFTGDGRRDWLVARLRDTFVEMVWLIDDGVGGYTMSAGVTPPGVQIPLPDPPLVHFPLGDIDGDGDPDLLTQDGHWENDGTALGASKVASFAGDAHDAVDFDGDGDLDILVVHWEGTAWIYTTRLLIQSGGTFVPQVLNVWSGKTLAFFRDLDLDGDADIVASRVDGGLTAVHENFGGAAVDRGLLPLMLTSKAALAVHDHDGDGLADLFGIGTGELPGFGIHAAVGPAWFRRLGPGLVYSVPEMYRAPYGVRALFDADGDGDIDSVGPYSFYGLQQVAPQSGKIRQYGTAAPGTGGIRPILGASGPMSIGSTTAVEHVRRGLGGMPAILIYGFNESAIAGFPLAGLTLYTNPFVIFGTFALSGPPGVPGAGSFDFVLPTGPELGGLRIYKQAFVIDLAAPSGIASHTNGLELVWGS